jgi:hypothetical protein
VGFAVELPDFTDCSTATPEADGDWFSVVHEGGPVRALDRHMPAFGEALTDDEITRVIAHLRTFCRQPRAWPRGDLNLPRALFTDKAFPENEAVLVTSVSEHGKGVLNQLEYEHRIGPRSQFEIAIPYAFQKNGEGNWKQGIGDVALALKHVLSHNLESGRILSLTTELSLPTGRDEDGLGSDVAVLEPYLALGQLLPSDGFLQMQAGMELPFDRDKAENEVFWRAAVGKTFVERRFGRAWTPMVEVLGEKQLEHGQPTLWDVVPQIQVSLSKLQHVQLGVGVALPINERDGRDWTMRMYVLWDWFDGGVLEGWR